MSKQTTPPRNPRRGATVKAPAAPPAYRPQPAPKVLQRKPAPTAQTPVTRKKTAPAAPPVYRPQPAPKVLQAKSANGSGRPGTKSVGTRTAAPPVYRPQPPPRVLQPKMAGPQRPAVQRKSAPQAPPVYRPQPTPKCLQPKMAAARPPLGEPRRPPTAPPVYRPGPSKSVQLKTLKPAPPARGGGQVVQRLIITSNLDSDVEYAKVKRFLVEKGGAGDRVAAPGDRVNITETNPNEPLYILQHGGEPTRQALGTIMGWDPGRLLGILREMGFDPTLHVGRIQLLSCNSGMNVPGSETDQSYAARFSNLLRENGYRGTVSAVTGSLNPLGIGRPNEPITQEHLWQGDPVFALLKEIDRVRGEHYTETLFKVQDYVSGSEPEDENTWKVMLREFVKDGMYIIQVCDQAGALLNGFVLYKNLLADWRRRFLESLIELNRVQLACPDIKASELTNKEELDEALTGVCRALEEFEQLMPNYADARAEQGYRKGLMGGLFKPLEMVDY